ncbi:MAG: acyl-CoA dehydrogenase family protein [Proteobacteria bacterium]|nr:acyl-CoA dehydrogenase family protein [Pseudomonadota bacterium]
MVFEPSAELKQFLETIRKFVEKECYPVEMEIEEKGEVPEHIIKGLCQLGLFGVTTPTEYGGLGLSIIDYCLILIELSRTNAAVRSQITTNNGVGSKGILFDGTEEQKKKYLPSLASGEKMASFALTEPGAGSDASAISTTAVKKGSNWAINGTKYFITNAPRASIFTVLALTDKEKRARGGITAFIVEKGTPGLVIGKIFKAMGNVGSKPAEVIFEDCQVPEENIIGGPKMVGQGFRTAMKSLNEARITLSASMIGFAERALKLARDYAKIRVQFGKPIAENQAIQWMLADSATEIYASRCMLFDAAARVDAGQKVDAMCSMTKVFASEMLCRVTDRSLQIHGGTGYIKESPIEHLYRDARMFRIVEGTSEIQRMIIARDVLKD